MIKQVVGKRVLVRLLRMNDEILLKDGTTLWLDIDFEHVPHIPVVGEVIKSHDEEVLKAGDMVLFDRAEAEIALKRDGIPRLVENGKTCVFLPFDAIYAVRRGERVFTVNDYVIILPMKEETQTESGIVLTVNPKKIMNKCIIHLAPEGMDLKEGDVVAYKGKYAAVTVEHDIHRQFLPEGSSRMKADKILALLSRETPQSLTGLTHKFLPCVGHAFEKGE